METFVKGEVVVLPFPFSDFSAFKNRPAMIIAKMDGDDVVLCQITGTKRNDGYTIDLTDANFEVGNLMGDSLIRANKLFTVDQKAVLYKVGLVKQEKIKEVEDKVVGLIRGESA
ncbi:MAG TPA: type II toxin-antitoxin system PemK/MazF family toxin [Candidatus Nanoarchaeia archaeon]|nr:type II toxin-antitoxin system PemK/MazF family toxin [Candidatus Nanoarchaeia archaeon]